MTWLWNPFKNHRVQKNEKAIGEKVLADAFVYGESDIPSAKEWNINGENTKIGVKKV